MEDRIRNFFEGPGKKATEHLGSGANILIMIDETSYTLKITEDRKVEVEKDEKQECDIKITAEEKTMNDLFSSSNMDEFSEKMRSYIRDGKQPEVTILMTRTVEKLRKFHRVYYYFLRKMVLLK